MNRSLIAGLAMLALLGTACGSDNSDKRQITSFGVPDEAPAASDVTDPYEISKAIRKGETVVVSQPVVPDPLSQRYGGFDK